MPKITIENIKDSKQCVCTRIIQRNTPHYRCDSCKKIYCSICAIKARYFCNHDDGSQDVLTFVTNNSYKTIESK